MGVGADQRNRDVSFRDAGPGVGATGARLEIEATDRVEQQTRRRLDLLDRNGLHVQRGVDGDRTGLRSYLRSLTSVHSSI